MILFFFKGKELTTAGTSNNDTSLGTRQRVPVSCEFIGR